MKLLTNVTWSSRTLGLAALAVLVLGLAPVEAQTFRRNNPPGSPRRVMGVVGWLPGPPGGPGTNWVRPGGPRAPRSIVRVRPHYRGGLRVRPGLYGGFAFGFGYRRGRPGFRSNPPGPRGGWGTNWANPPGPAGGTGSSPYRLRPYRRYADALSARRSIASWPEW